jgi:hypothetical protein
VISIGRLLLASCACVALAGPASAQSEDEIAATHVEQVATPDAVRAALGRLPGPVNAPHRNRLAWVDLDTIVNLGETVWTIIQDNRPVVDASYEFANALPSGVADAGELEGFSDLQMTSYRVWGENVFGMQLYSVTYTLVHQYGGSYDGRGRYLATVAVVPSQIEAAWSFNVNMSVSKVSATNVGSRTAPVGSVVMDLTLKISSLLSSYQETTLFQFRGDSADVIESM